MVIGGGITGVGVTRDLATRGVDVRLIERGGLAAGATGAMHGLCHSGARYALGEPTSARQCHRESRVLRAIAPHTLDETGGLFLAHEDDATDHVDRRLAACRDCEIPVESLDGRAIRELEPAVSPQVERGFTVPDAVIDPTRLVAATAAAAERAGARITTHARVTELETDGRVTDRHVTDSRVTDSHVTDGRVTDDHVTDSRVTDDHVTDSHVTGVTIEHGTGPSKARPTVPTGPDEAVPSGTRERIRADHVVNAAGAWAGRVATLADCSVRMAPTRGVMVVLDRNPTERVCNRCRPKTDGDILVPGAAGGIAGTTSVEVTDPDDYPREAWERRLVIDELATVVPSVAEADVRTAYWGVRPLYDPPETTGDGRAAGDDPTATSRGFRIIDHAREGRPGLTTVVGGKLTTHRLMAERVSDRVAETLGVTADCVTADRPLPGADDRTALDPYLAAFDLTPSADRRLL